jgi:viroplasmin and RNaseH domain-containing protein
MAKKYNLTYKFFDTEEQAKNFCDKENTQNSYYLQKNHPARYTSWTSTNGKENKFIAWYVF